MDWLEAVSSWIGSLAWPATLVTLVVLLKAPLSTALSTIRHIEAPGVKADFGALIGDAEDRSENLKEELPADASDPAPAETTNSTDDPAAQDPSGVIIRAWQQLHDEVVEYAKVSGILREGHSRSIRFLVHGFQVNSLLTRDATFTILELSDLRNRVAHGAHIPTTGEAITYRTTAENVRSYVQFFREHEVSHGRGERSAPTPDDPSTATQPSPTQPPANEISRLDGR